MVTNGNAWREKVDRGKRYSRQEIGSLLGVSYSTVRRLVHRGLLLEENHMGSKRILGGDLLRYLRQVREQSRVYVGGGEGGGSSSSPRLNLNRFRKEKGTTAC